MTDGDTEALFYGTATPTCVGWCAGTDYPVCRAQNRQPVPAFLSIITFLQEESVIQAVGVVAVNARLPSLLIMVRSLAQV